MTRDNYGRHLVLTGMENAIRFMTPEQYREFNEKMLEQVRPELDAQAEARVISEHATRWHFFY
jgi:chromosome segregation and condensation protein ScpB